MHVDTTNYTDCFSEDSPKNALSLQISVYHVIDAFLKSQLKRVLFLVGKRGCDISFSNGRKKVVVKIPKAFQSDFLNVGLGGKGSICITIEAHDDFQDIGRLNLFF